MIDVLATTTTAGASFDHGPALTTSIVIGLILWMLAIVAFGTRRR